MDEIAAVVFIDIAVIVVVARLMAALFRRIGQPAVIGEILAGLVLGPSLLGTLPGNPTEALFPGDVRPFLTIVASLGLIIFMFIVGLELDTSLVRGQGRIAASISFSSVVLPFAMGCGLAIWLHRSHGGAKGHPVELLPFALFIGVSMSITAFPVLARILSERRMLHTRTGALSLACAAVDDILAWSLLAIVLAVVNSDGLSGVPLIAIKAIAFLAVMHYLVRPRLQGLVRRHAADGRLTPDIFAVVLVGVLVCSFITSQIGIHAIFGAFVFGVMMPRRDAERLSKEILEKIEQVTVLLLLPVFFITTGLNADVGALGATGLVQFLAILAVACAGKFIGAAAAARVVGVRPRRATAIGILMNTRGLTELVVLNIGLTLGVLDRQLFTILVLMAVVTTVITAPLLRLVFPPRIVARERADAERAALGLDATYRVVVVVDETDNEPLIDVGVGLLGGEQSGELLISRFDPPAPSVEVGAGLVSELVAIAESFDELQVLSRRAQGQGVRAVVRSQFSDDPTADVLAQSLAVQADLLVVDGRDPARCARLLSDADCAVAVLALGAGATSSIDPAAALHPRSWSRVRVAVGPGHGSLAAIEQGLRFSLSAGAVLELVDADGRKNRRRLATVGARLALAGIAVAANDGEPSDTDRTLHVSDQDVNRSRTQLGASLVVREARDDHGESLDKLLDLLLAAHVGDVDPYDAAEPAHT
jgi:Kef-type K+ transport system membrane component KefB